MHVGLVCKWTRLRLHWLSFIACWSCVFSSLEVRQPGLVFKMSSAYGGEREPGVAPGRAQDEMVDSAVPHVADTESVQKTEKDEGPTLRTTFPETWLWVDALTRWMMSLPTKCCHLRACGEWEMWHLHTQTLDADPILHGSTECLVGGVKLGLS